MDMACPGEALYIEVVHAKVSDRTRVGEHMAFCSVRKQQRNACLPVVSPLHARNIYAALGKPLTGEASERIVPHHTLKRHSHSHRREVVRHNRRGTPKSYDKVGSQKLAFRWHGRRKPIENEVEVQFARNCNVKARFHNGLFLPLYGDNYFGCTSCLPMEYY